MTSTDNQGATIPTVGVSDNSNAGAIPTPNINASTNAGGQTNSQDVSTPGAPVTFPSNWKDGLGDDIKSDPSLAKFTSIPDLAKSYLQIQKAMGGNKITLPDAKLGTEEDWKGVFQKLGLPEKSESYEIEAPKDAFKPEFVKAFKEQAFKTNMLPKQAEKLLGWYADLQKQQMQQQNEAAQMHLQKSVQTLKTEWGEAFDSRKLRAETAVKRFFNNEGVDFLEKSGLVNNVHFAKAFASIGELLQEHGIKGQPASYSGLTPEDAKQKIGEINGNRQHPYWSKAHPNHQQAIEQMNLYFKSAYPEGT